jgi:outer membrane immunogenic protein
VFSLLQPVALTKQTGTYKMKLLSRIAGLTLTSLAALTCANAADMYRPAAVKDGPYGPGVWSGFYFGINGGYAWSAYDNKYSYPAVVDEYAAYGGIGSDGGFGGGQFGYNWQGGSPFLLGFEADIQGAGIGNSVLDLYKTQLDWFGTVRGRIGYTVDRTLLYFTGGYAYGGLKSEIVDLAVFDNTVSGYVLGGGAEYKFNPSWSVKAEYQYLNFGKNEPVDVHGHTATDLGYNTPDDAFHTVRVGLNYHPMPGYEPLK